MPAMDNNTMMRPLDVRQVRTRLALRSAMLDMARNVPFDEITIADLVSQAGVSQATFYRHYKDKNALLTDLARDFTNELGRKITPETIITDSRKAAQALCSFLEENRAVCAALLSHGAKSAIFDDILENAVNHSAASGITEEIWLPRSLGPVFMVTTLLTLIGWWLHKGKSITITEMSELIDRLVFIPVLPEA
ncbi:TetR/AcrR family transcriptional regulator [Novosphingobium sp. G106]|uniref:TetR/AcrR family transcriptional regulator n=1 Tax=Novosphingobium sp. G106 TaxID=2849500 RepID=UPI001C2D6624|nr:TetR/AcrR family transcriptional regulator [Novosphingobium sp. G106]MBV1688192.1 TetR/AcrR family transcriptional regulator [Novosphingobium sp. G106]